MNNNSTYRRLGDYIEQRREKNKGFDVPIRGVSKEGFIPPKQQDADVSLYNVFYKNDFVFNPARMELNSIALNEDLEQGICSSLYEIFYIKDTNVLDPLYLNLLIKTDHFTRFCEFVGWGSVREYCRFADISEFYIEVPPIEQQHKVVEYFNAIRTRIANNKQTIAKLEEAAQALYRKMFVDDVDVENLPEGWRMGRIKEFCKEMKSGGTPSRTNNSYWDSKDIPWLKSGEVHNNVIWNTEDFISESGLKNSSAKLIPADSVIMAMYGATAAQVAYLKCETTTNQACCNMICYSKEDAAYLYFHLLNHQEEIKVLANGGAQENLSQELIANQPIILGFVSDKFAIIIEQISLLTKENNSLTEMLSVMA